MSYFDEKCPFCKHHPYEYVDIGVGMERVAITCCGWMAELWRGDKLARKILFLMRSHSPRRKARAKRLMEEHE